MTDTSQTVAAGQLRAFIERILRLKEEQDTIGDDIKEIYAEAKGNGFDKTAMGQLVTYLRKKDKDAAKLEEQSAIFDLYREAYEQPSHAHTREGRRNSPSIVSVNPSGHARKGSGDANAGGDHEGVTQTPIGKIDCDLIEQDVTLRADAEALGSTVEPGAPFSEPFEPPAFLKRDVKPLRPHCRRPDDCAGYGATHCGSCLRAARETEAA